MKLLGDTNVAVVMGCKSAKDRTISIVLGNSMLQTLFEKRLADSGEIENLLINRDILVAIH